MAKDQTSATEKKAPSTGKPGVRVGGGIITGDTRRAPKPTKRGVRIGGGIITAD